jgi:hypothetical protein
MPTASGGDEAILDAWRVNDRVTTYLVENLPPALFGASLSGVSRRNQPGGGCPGTFLRSAGDFQGKEKRRNRT